MEEPSVASIPVSSFMTRATNVFTAPTELYGEIAAAPAQTSSWLLPYIAAILLGIVSVFAVYNNSILRQQIYDMQEQGMQKAVEQGKMTQDQYERAKDSIESSGPVMFMVIGGFGIIISLTVYFFGVSLVLWLVVKFGLKAGAAYSKLLESYGLASLIGFCGGIITLLLINLFDSMHATPSAALLVMNSFDQTKFVHNVLSSINAFSIWQTSIVGIAVAKISNKSTGAGIGVSFGLWLVWVICASALGWVR